MTAAIETPAPCACCGSYTQTTLALQPSLLSVCDVLVLKALETLGKRIVRVERSRYARRGDTPWYLVHLLWQPDDRMIDKALEGAWDVVPAILGQPGHDGLTAKHLTVMLDDYTRHIVRQGIGHSPQELRWRFEQALSGVGSHG
jgi:hypothetical protein